MMTSRSAFPNLASTAIAGALAMAAAMGFGRFSFTPILPGMIAGLPLSSGDAGLVAAANFAGYLVGAVLAGHGWASGRERAVALVALLASALLQMAMGLSSSVVLFILIRFLAGLASAFAMVFVSAIVLGHAAVRGSEHAQSTHFGGVGFGIAASSLVVLLIGNIELAGLQGWRLEWFAGAAVSLALFAVTWKLLPPPPLRSGQEASEPPLQWTVPLLLTTLSYGLFGFGYVVTATFVVAIARMGDAGAVVEFLTWFLAGVTAAVSMFAWQPFLRRFGMPAAFVTALVIEAFGVVATVMLPLPAASIVGGLLLGATFMMITASGLRIGRRLSPASPRKTLAFMTAAFGVGQILGPLLAGMIAERTGSFAGPSLIAACVLLAAALVFTPVLKASSR